MKPLGLIAVVALLVLPGCSGEVEKDDASSKKARGESQSEKDPRNDSEKKQAAKTYQYRVKIFAGADEIEHPNGLLVDNGKLIVAGWGLELQDGLATRTPGKIVGLDLIETMQHDITKNPLGNLDGVESDGDDGYYVSDHISGKVYHVHGGGHVHEILSLPPGAADLAFLVDQQLLVVPEMLENRVTAFDLSDPEATNSAGGPPVVWTITEGIQTPESVYYDADSETLFLSQIGEGGATGKDGDGCISKLSIGGEVVKNKWITELNAPKGLRSYNGVLWVADIDRLVVIDISQGEIMQEVLIPGAKFLNDIACDEEGTIYVSDLVDRKIYTCRRAR